MIKKYPAIGGELMCMIVSLGLFYYIPANWYTITQIPAVGEGVEVVLSVAVVVGSKVEESPAAVQRPDPSS